MSGNIPHGWNFIVELPRRSYAKNNETAVVEKSWKTELPDGVGFGGQKFFFPEGLTACAEVQWIEEQLLSVRVTVEGTVKGECARCLADAKLAISDNLVYLYHLRGLEFGKDSKIQSDEGFMPVEVDYWGRTLSLSDQVWETLLTLLPVKLLCKEDCAGLCPECGHDLNKGACSCKAQETDPRLEILRGIFPVGANYPLDR